MVVCGAGHVAPQRLIGGAVLIAWPILPPCRNDPEPNLVEAAFKELQDSGQYVVREVVAGRIIAAPRFGERDPAP
jgi:hypothetical protein